MWASSDKKQKKDAGADRYSAYVEDYAALVGKMIEENRAPWQRTWSAGQAAGGMPYNAVSGKGYSAANALYLFMAQALNGYADDRWLTYKQAQDLGANIRKGERGTPLVKWLELAQKDSAQDKGPANADDEKKRMVPILFTVFNAEQCEGLAPAPERKQLTECERHAQCEKLLADSGVEIVYAGAQPCYIPGWDRIIVPKREDFTSLNEFYAAATHELGHASGHKSRLDRDLSGKFGSESYAREELNAEIFSFMVGQRLQIGHDGAQHAAYLQHWVKIVRDDPKAILTACRNAEKMCDFLGIAKYEHEATQKLERTQEQANAHTATPDEGRVVPMLVPSPDARPVPARQRGQDRAQDFGMAM